MSKSTVSHFYLQIKLMKESAQKKKVRFKRHFLGEVFEVDCNLNRTTITAIRTAFKDRFVEINQYKAHEFRFRMLSREEPTRDWKRKAIRKLISGRIVFGRVSLLAWIVQRVSNVYVRRVTCSSDTVMTTKLKKK